VARELLGRQLRSTVGGVVTAGIVVEAEAYIGPQDPASHAARRIGRTRRNQAMFGLPGTAYVYRSYGIHWCLNVVTDREDYPSAVLLRAVEPMTGLEAMRARRGGREPLCSGPGRLTQALGVSGELDGHDLGKDPLVLCDGRAVEDDRIGVSGRIGISRATDWPLRFFVRGHPAVSGTPR